MSKLIIIFHFSKKVSTHVPKIICETAEKVPTFDQLKLVENRSKLVKKGLFDQ